MSAPRTRTPPDIKWLANELAATAGELERLDVELVRIQTRQKHLQKTYLAMSQVAVQLQVPQLPYVMPKVKPHYGYGKRGNLRNWLENLLRSAAPRGVATATALDMAQQAFGLEFSTPLARTKFLRNSLTRQLRVFVAEGLVERLHDPLGPCVLQGIWRWRSEIPSVQELAVQVELTQSNRAECI